MGDLTLVAPKLAKLLPMLSTSHDGEVVAAARAIGRTLQSAELDWHNIAAALATVPAIERDGSDRPSGDDPGSIAPSDWHVMAKWARDNDRGRLSDRERAFVHDLAAPVRLRRGFHPSVKQAEWLRAIFLNLVRWVP